MVNMKILEEKIVFNKFDFISSKINDILDSLNLNLDDKIIKGEWDEWRIKFRGSLQTGINRNFLTQTDIGGLMFQKDVNVINAEIDNMDTNLFDNIIEYDFSNKNFTYNNKLISTNTIHHLYHLSRFLDKKDGSKVKTIIEWGGGYGNMAKLSFETFKNLNRYTIIDLPEFIVLQYIYLVSYYGEDNVRIVRDIKDMGDGINLIAVNDSMSMSFDKHDMFISTWAITESSLFCQEFVDKNGFLNYNNLLIAYHQCGNHIPFMYESSVMDKKLKDMGAYIEKINFIPGINYYGIK